MPICLGFRGCPLYKYIKCVPNLGAFHSFPTLFYVQVPRLPRPRSRKWPWLQVLALFE